MKCISSVSLALVVVAAGCSAPSSGTSADAPPLAVSTARAELSDLASSFEAGGVVRARATAAIASRILAPIIAVHVRPGNRVRRGTPLVTLDAREITANRARADAALAGAVETARAAESETRAAEAALALARVTSDRMHTLHEKRSATAQELDRAVAAVDAADARLTGARARMAAAAAGREAARAAVDAAAVAASYAVLTAPFDGLVTERSIDPGSLATPGAPLLTLEDPTAFRLEVSLDEARAAGIAIGEAAAVTVGDAGEAADRPLSAHVSEVARVDPASHSFLVKLDLPHDPRLRSGVFGRARFRGPARRALTVPASAAVHRGQLTFVFTVDGDHRARLRPISPGEQSGDRLEVLAGLQPADRVITPPPALLRDGARVSGEHS